MGAVAPKQQPERQRGQQPPDDDEEWFHNPNRARSCNISVNLSKLGATISGLVLAVRVGRFSGQSGFWQLPSASTFLSQN
jgi:hypothetical protein